MEEKARQKFLLKVYNLGFLIEEHGDSLILRPRGYSLPAEITITEAEPNIWTVGAASGAYTRFRQKKYREWFEAQINHAAYLATQEVL